ncbi:MAG: Xaa-Pro aminopeptidase [Gammaproteobacteria bacterium]
MNIKAKDFARRRKQLMRMIDSGGVAILPAAPERIRNRDVHYPYRPDSDFYYLTGFAEPESVAVLAPGREHGEFILFCRERDPERETWDGKRAGQEGAVNEYGADDSFPIDDIDEILPGILERRDKVYYTFGAYPEFDNQLMGWVNTLRQRSRAGARAPSEFVALEHLLHEMRLFKSAAEARVMRHSAKIAVAAHERALAACKPGMGEWEMEAEFLYHFRSEGAEPSYPSIVGGGENGCVLHYIENGSVLRDGDLLLIDAGAEYDYYASDITRTFPVNGRFSKAQKAVYEVVLEAQQAAIEQVRPGRHWDDPHRAAVRVLTEGMVELGILKGDVDELIENEGYRRFYMHRTGHWLGMDVHDVGDYKVDDQWRELEPGMALTVEPGLYIPAGSKGVPKKYWGIGIRIEDDVLVTKDGHEVLTGGLAKSVAEIEALMSA